MTIQVSWHNDHQTAITICYQRPWDWAEFEKARVQLLALLDGTHHPVDLVLDVRDAGAPPSGAFGHFQKSLQTNHPNTRQVIFLGERLLVTSFLDVLLRVYGRFTSTSLIRFVDSLEEAEALLAQGGDAHQDASAGE